MSSPLQFELERTGAPFGCVTVEHGALSEGHIIFCVYQDYCIGPEWAGGTRDIQGNEYKKYQMNVIKKA